MLACKFKRRIGRLPGGVLKNVLNLKDFHRDNFPFTLIGELGEALALLSDIIQNHQDFSGLFVAVFRSAVRNMRRSSI